MVQFIHLVINSHSAVKRHSCVLLPQYQIYCCDFVSWNCRPHHFDIVGVCVCTCLEYCEAWMSQNGFNPPKRRNTLNLVEVCFRFIFCSLKFMIIFSNIFISVSDRVFGDLCKASFVCAAWPLYKDHLIWRKWPVKIFTFERQVNFSTSLILVGLWPWLCVWSITWLPADSDHCYYSHGWSL